MNLSTHQLRFPLSIGCISLAALLMSGCATGPDRNPRDPLEPFNRGVYKFNDAVDRAVLKPVATVYRDATPSVVRTGVGNFFRNLSEPWSFVNNVLQLRIQDAGETWIRFAVNTVFGLGGLIDIAGEARIERHKQDFGQTLEHYGVPSGPFVMLPILGPSTVRDTAALPVDAQGNLLSGLNEVAVRNSLYALRVVDTRARYLRFTSVLDGASLDPYSFTRDSFLQRLDTRGQKSETGTPEEMNDTLPVR